MFFSSALAMLAAPSSVIELLASSYCGCVQRSSCLIVELVSIACAMIDAPESPIEFLSIVIVSVYIDLVGRQKGWLGGA